MSKPDSWMPLYVADYIADTTRLTTEQHGAYLLLIIDYWRNGPPPNDDAVLARITGLTLSRWKAHRPTLQPFFEIVGKTWQHKRVNHEFEKAAGISKAKQTAGKLGGEAKAKAVAERLANELAKAKQTPTPSPSPSQESLPGPSPSPSPEKTKTAPTRKKRELASLPEGWKPSPEKAQKLTQEFNLPEDGIERYTQAFHDACKAKGYEYRDFDAAFANCVRQDWPKFRVNGAMKGRQKTAAELIDEAEANRNRQAASDTPQLALRAV